MTFIGRYFKASRTPTIDVSNVTLLVNETFQWIFSGLNINVSQCRLDSIRIEGQEDQSNYTDQKVENPQIIIHNSSFNSLDLKPRTKAQITDCYTDAQFQPRPTLITVNNSDLSIQNSHLENFVNENHSTILFGHNNSNVTIENSTFIQHNSSKGVLLLHNNSSIHISSSSILQNIAFTVGYSAVTLRHTIHAVIHNTVFGNNSASVGGALFAEDQCQVILANCTFSSNMAITDKRVNISKNSNLQKVIHDRNNTGAHKPIRSILFNQTSSDAKKYKTISAQHAQLPIRSSILKKMSARFLTRNYNVKEHSAEQEGVSMGMGGALFVVKQSLLLVTKCLFKDNSAQYSAGAIAAGINVILEILETTFVGNKALEGGAFNVDQQSYLLMRNCILKNNLAQYNGGAVVAVINVTLDIQETTFVGNKASEGGAITVQNQTHLRITNCVFDDNISQDLGGAIVGSYNVTLGIQETIFVGNKALSDGGAGGAIDVEQQAQFRIRNCVFKDNSAQYIAGAITTSFNVTLDIQETTFVGNKALSDAGAIDLQHQAQLRITNCVFDDNASQRVAGTGAISGSNHTTLDIQETNFTGNTGDEGGAIAVGLASHLYIRDCTLKDNRAKRMGGAIVGGHRDVIIEINKTYFLNNSARQGGAIHVTQQASLFITNCIVERNSARGPGGAIAAAYNVTLTMRESIFTGNSASYGGALGVSLQSKCHIDWCVFHSNAANETGGSVGIGVKSSLQIENTNFTNNNNSNGGAIELTESRAEIESCQFLSNQAMSGSGGALDLDNPDYVTVRGTLLRGNVASDSGGAISISGGSNVIMNNIKCIGNRAPGNGGCLFIGYVTLTLNNSEISGNIGQRAVLVFLLGI